MTHAFYYGLFAGRGRELLAETLGEPDPFDLPPAEILDRVVGMGFGPDLAQESRRPFAIGAGWSRTVDRADQRFIISVDAAAETIAVQEIRRDRYDCA